MTVPLPILLVLIYRNGRVMHAFFLRAWRKWSNLTDALSDVVPGIRVVQAFDQAEHEKRRFGERNDDFTDECFRIHDVWTGFWPILMVLVHSMTILTWVFALPRLSTLKRATRLLVLKEGRLIEQGTHAQLLEIPNGVYRRLHDMQIQLNEVHAI